MNWIKTTDQLPSEGEKVIFFFKWSGVHRGLFTNFKIGPLPFIPCFSIGNQWFGSGITHWMSDEGQDLPEQPNDVDWGEED